MASFQLIYPERRRISSGELLLMGQQAYDDGDLLVRPVNGTEAAEMLSQEGIVTLSRLTPQPTRR
tara:strand:- start:274 stop:468 length:195 start_codon:yes stop_codon:yes gene_type:complete